MTKKFSKEYFTSGRDLPWSALEDKVIDSSRWSINHEIIFENDGKYWKTCYSVGATECQDERPWDDIDEVECTEVEKRIIEVEEWVEIE